MQGIRKSHILSQRIESFEAKGGLYLSFCILDKRTLKLLVDYAKQRGLKASSARSHVIFYYGKRSVPAPMGIVGDEIDDHFGMSLVAEIEAVNEYFRRRLFEILSN